MQNALAYEQGLKKAKANKKKKRKLTKEEKRLRAIEKLVDDDLLDQIKAMNLKELKTRVNECVLNIKREKDEFHAEHGEEEQRLKDALAELRQPRDDAIKYQEAIRDYATMRQELLNADV